MDEDWRKSRHLDGVREGLEEKGWEPGAVRHVDLSPVVAESGPYLIVFRWRDSDTGESLFEVREMRQGEERRVVLVWGVPTPEEAESLLERYGLAPDGSPSEASADPVGLWAGLLPPVVHAEGSLRGGR